MILDKILRPLEGMEEYKYMMESIASGKKVLEVHGVSDTQKALLAAALNKQMGVQCVYITHNDMTARKISEDLSFFGANLGDVLPALELTFRRVDARSSEIRQKRLQVINDALRGKCGIICASIEALLPKLVSPESFTAMFKNVKVGEVLDIGAFTSYMVKSGYERIGMVEGKGQFSIRGGIIDFYPPNEENPIRIELFDDEVDSIRYFDILTQRSIEKAMEVDVIPVKELILDDEDLKKAAVKLEGEINKRAKSLMGSKKKSTEAAEKLRAHFSEDLEKLRQGIFFDGMEKYLHYFENRFCSFLEYFKDCIIIVDEPVRVRQRYDAHQFELQEYFKHLLEENEVLPDQFNIMHSYDELLIKMKDRKLVCMNTLLRSSSDFKPHRIISFTSRSIHPFHGKISLMLDEIELWKKKKYRVVILSGGEERGKRLVEELREKSIEALYKEQLDIDLQEGHIIVTPGMLNDGFEFPTVKYALISDREVVRQTRKTSDKKRGRVIKVFTDLKIGDFVVHENHGIGQYIGIEKLKIDGLSRDYLHIRYSGTDKLYIPTDQMDLIQKYIGNDEKGPKLNKLGSAEWTKTKAKAKKSIEDMAHDLLKLYAERQQTKGYPFSKDTRWQREFEDMFPYQETTDQLKCIEEIKADMESQKVMDRLLCGDVGYGKTEVALRAAFKCVMEGKQVAVLVPTTILAQQHFNTCVQRISSFPIKAEVLSRFKTAQEQKKVAAEVRKGAVDIVIGTHRLLQGDISFKDLGLLVVDEEQRFGVAHKEKIKAMKKDVDVLTLSATPIPRTLHMSMIGVRDISIIEEPPEERYPVQTYVMEYNEELIRDAIVKEISREGQVYYLHNRVRNISKVAGRIKELVPEARVAFAHGQMGEKQLEDTMLDFFNGEFDVLVCTTIIESGLDIPNVNTIIINDADKMGLSQLYQLRGRVGRSNRLAYAYFTYQKDKVLNEVAEKRLRAIKEFTEFGSGFKIAMRDLEIRGTGNLLGRDQHGHMEAIGYDLYIKLLEDTVRELKGEAPQSSMDTSIELQVNAYIPETYIADENQKIEIYKKIAYIESQEDIYDIEEEIEDRFGDIPAYVKNLMSIAYIKNNARKCGIISIAQKGNNVIIKYKSDKSISAETAVIIASEYKNGILFTASEQPYFTVRIGDVRPEECIKIIRELIEKIYSFQNPKISV